MAGLEAFQQDHRFPVVDAAKLGIKGFQTFAPQTFADMTSWLPSWSADLGLPTLSEIGASVGLEGLAPALSGAFAAFGPAGAALAVAKILSAIAPPDDTAVSYGSGMGDLANGYQHLMGPRSPQYLYDQWKGDGSWYEGGDPSGVQLPIDHGSMSMKREMPYHAIGGVPYQTPELAVNSGRQIARGQMGLDVPYEALPNAYDPQGIAGLVDVMNGRSMQIYDAPGVLPDQWNAMLARRNNLGTGEGQSSQDVGLDAFVAGMDPRQRQFFDAGMTQDQLWKFTGPQMAELSPIEQSKADTTQRIAAASGVDVTGAQPWDPKTYGMGPQRTFFPDRTKGGPYKDVTWS